MANIWTDRFGNTITVQEKYPDGTVKQDLTQQLLGTVKVLKFWYDTEARSYTCLLIAVNKKLETDTYTFKAGTVDLCKDKTLEWSILFGLEGQDGTKLGHLDFHFVGNMTAGPRSPYDVYTGEACLI